VKDNLITAKVAKRLGFNKEVVETIYKEIIQEIVACLETEEPILLRGFGEFYFRYQKKASHDLVAKSLKFRAVGYSSELLEKKSSCIGIRSTDSITLAQMGVKQEDVPKIRAVAQAMQVKGHLEMRIFDGTIDLQKVASNIDSSIEMLASKGELE